MTLNVTELVGLCGILFGIVCTLLGILYRDLVKKQDAQMDMLREMKKETDTFRSILLTIAFTKSDDPDALARIVLRLLAQGPQE